MIKQLKDIFENKSVAIAGFGVEGRAAYSFLTGVDCKITVVDEDADTTVPNGVVSVLGEQWLSHIKDYDVVLRTSGMHPNKLAEANLVTTSSDLLLDIYGSQTIAITGTKGKTTTVKLLAKILEAANQPVELVGNVGRSSWEILSDEIEPETAIVAELSSFQLSDIKHSPHIAGLLPVTADHLDWHQQREDYIDSKLNLIRFQSAMDTLVIDKQSAQNLNVDSNTTAEVKFIDELVEQKATTISTEYGEIVISELRLKGQHNLHDTKLAFSLAVEWLHKHGQTLDEHWENIRRTITEFEPLAYHLEDLGEINGIKIINDSYSSNPTAAAAAIKAVSGQKTIIIGGEPKGVSIVDLPKIFDEHAVQAVVVIGANKDYCQKIANAVSESSKAQINVVGEQQMSTILNAAIQISSERTTILFSPAHASYDMYNNFTERGKLFTEAVHKLQG